jgi:beta-mannosidase
VQEQSLNGSWQFRESGADEWRAATVPGSIHTDLLAAGLIPDPFYADNEIRVQWVAERSWEYRCAFTVGRDLLAHDQVELVCDGLDTVAAVTINGERVGEADNMFRAYRWDVKGLLREGENEIVVAFQSPVRVCAERGRAQHLPTVNGVFEGAQTLRKAPCHFGWDWGPNLPTAGIWRDIRLEGYSAARIDDVHLRQEHAAGRVTLRANIGAVRWTDAPLTARLTVTAPDGKQFSAEGTIEGNSAALTVEIDEPQLWWPNGMGAQPLYEVDIKLVAARRNQVSNRNLVSSAAPLDRRACQIGLRTVELRRELDQWGQSFTFAVNGVPLFAKGANWIPADSFPARIPDALYEHLLRSAADANMNMLRVWGGGFYEDERFYDLCDRYGILLWHDFMFACSVYPFNDAAFVENVRREVEDNVGRIRHRACLALWCGNNEMEAGWVNWGWDTPANAELKAADIAFFYNTLPAWLKALDPDTPYWPSSPSSGMPHEVPDSRHAGDTHLWEVWHALKPIDYYREINPRFASEFGMQSMPALATVPDYAPADTWNLTSYVMEHHQRHPNGNGKIIGYMTQHYRQPKDFASAVYLTHILQAEAMRVGIEHWRRTWPRCAGALYWQLNDCWPVASWSSIDSTGRWKALQYVARRFFAPVLLSVEPVSNLDSFSGAPGYGKANALRFRLYLNNDTREAFEGQVNWSLEAFDGRPLRVGVAPVSVAAGAGAEVALLDFTADVTWDAARELVLVCELCAGDTALALVVTPFAPDKHLALADPQIAAEVVESIDGLTISLTSMTLARFVELSLEGADVIFSDNDFDLPAGRTVAVSCPLPEGWTVEQARAALRIRSEFDAS